MSRFDANRARVKARVDQIWGDRCVWTLGDQYPQAVRARVVVEPESIGNSIAVEPLIMAYVRAAKLSARPSVGDIVDITSGLMPGRYTVDSIQSVSASELACALKPTGAGGQ